MRPGSASAWAPDRVLVGDAMFLERCLADAGIDAGATIARYNGLSAYAIKMRATGAINEASSVHTAERGFQWKVVGPVD